MGTLRNLEVVLYSGSAPAPRAPAWLFRQYNSLRRLRRCRTHGRHPLTGSSHLPHPNQAQRAGQELTARPGAESVRAVPVAPVIRTDSLVDVDEFVAVQDCQAEIRQGRRGGRVDAVGRAVGYADGEVGPQAVAEQLR